MIISSLIIGALCATCHASGAVPVAQVGPPQVVAASSQYFERTFNRLVAAPVLEAPVVPVAPAPPVVAVQPVLRTTPAVVQPTIPTQVDNNGPNVAIAVATAHAAPVATILLPPYPFATAQQLGFIPSVPFNLIPNKEPKQRDPEPTTSTTERIQTTKRPQIPAPSNVETFNQGLPSNNDANVTPFYIPPAKPQKLKTTVEIVPVPLTYIAPPPLQLQPIKHIHAFVPTKARIIIRPAPSQIRYRRPARIVIRKVPLSVRSSGYRLGQVNLLRPVNREVEPTTFKLFNRPVTKPPRA